MNSLRTPSRIVPGACACEPDGSSCACTPDEDECEALTHEMQRAGVAANYARTRGDSATAHRELIAFRNARDTLLNGKPQAKPKHDHQHFDSERAAANALRERLANAWRQK